ncbi:unnamed protein product [Meloidogyne enterolobii]|uniref:TACO1/YebC-like N-terminal domain-containing protein n=2 Tax=Meloidogyne enterolobii TaxID=390850 RepID=A0A6V7X479_MELEN|nr:unnamed protein product [Meloidogyne enterolobii]
MSSKLFLYSQRIPLYLGNKNICLCSSNQKGHSHWDNIAKTKTTKDQEKAKRINAYSKRIFNAVKEGCDPKLNNKLAKVMEEYKKESLPMETFNKLLDRHKAEAEAKKQKGE